MATVTGQVQIPADAAFSGATLYVRLENVSLLDGAATVVTQHVAQAVASDDAPFDFTLDAGDIDEKESYNVRAHISMDGSEDFTQGDYISMQSYGVLTRGKPDTVTVEVSKI